MDDPVYVKGPRLREILDISASTYWRLLSEGLPTIGEGKLRRHRLDEVVDWYDNAPDEDEEATSVER